MQAKRMTHDEAVERARQVIEDILVDFRDSRIATPNAANGFVIREKDGSPSNIVRLDTRTGLSLAIIEYLKARGLDH